jgi:pyrroline-5-carboxylate reductase
MPIPKRLAFLGGGNMAEALLRGLLSAHVFEPGDLIVSDVRTDRLAALQQTYRVRTAASNVEAAGQAEALLLAVKPQVVPQVLADVRDILTEEHLLLSIAAGISSSTIVGAFARPPRLVRVMPNTPALVQEGASAVCRCQGATPEDMEAARTIFEAVGRVVLVEEPLLDAVTGLSGSGPAYVFVLIEALADAGVKMGLTRDIAQLLAAQTVRGAATMVRDTGRHPGVLKDTVTSPGGTTIAGLHALERAGFRAALIDAVEAATRRSRELGGR